MEGKSADTIIAFDEFEIDPGRRLLLSRGQVVPLKPKAFDLLVVLAERPGQILTKHALFDLLWSDQFVEENNLTVHIAALRKALGEKKGENRFIVTVPGQGYKFVAKLQDPVSNGSGKVDLVGTSKEKEAPKTALPGSGWKRTLVFGGFGVIIVAIAVAGLSFYFRTSRSGAAISSLAVLPLRNVGGEAQTDYLADGITESLINDLSQSPNLKVIAHGSVNRYKAVGEQNPQLDLDAIANDLGVQAVLTGKVEIRNDDVRVGVELVDVKSKMHLWGEQYERKLADVLSVQDEIARNISTKLRVRFQGDEPREVAKRYTDNIKAFENYTMGRAFIHRRTREDMITAVGYYEQAIRLDQDYALAYAGLADAYGNLGVRGYISPVEGRKKLHDAAQKAVDLDADLAEAHVAMGFYYIGFSPYDFPAGDREFERAIELSPSLALAHLYSSLSQLRQRRLDQGLAEMQKARDLDPYSSIIAHQMALYYNLTRDGARGLEFLRRADEMGPSFTAVSEIGIYIQNGLYDEALSAIKRSEQQRPNDPVLISDAGMAYAAKGETAAALDSIRRLQALSPNDLDQSQWIAKVYAVMGRKEDAIKWLGRAVDANEVGPFYEDDPAWDSIRNEPRFSELTTKMGIP